MTKSLLDTPGATGSQMQSSPSIVLQKVINVCQTNQGKNNQGSFTMSKRLS